MPFRAPNRYTQAVRHLLHSGIVFLLIAPCGLAKSKGCNAAPLTPSVVVDVPGRPFGVAVSQDGCWVFATLIGAPEKPAGLAVLRRDAGRLTMERLVPLAGSPTGIVLAPGGKRLLVATGGAVEVLDVARVTSGAPNPVETTFRDGPNPGSIYVNVTADGEFAFVSQEWAQSITVIDLAGKTVVGRVPVGIAPIALTFSLDGKLLYTTSQAALKEWGWPDVCKPEGANPPPGAPKHPEGAVVVIDVAKARTDPASAVVARIPAACNPVRLAMQSDGARIFVTARNSDSVLAFDTARLVADAEHARIGMVPVGTAPVPVIALRNGKTVVVGNSNRFGTAAGGGKSLTVLDGRKFADPGKAIVGSMSAGEFPRELRPSPDGKTLFLTNFNSSTVQMFDVKRLPVD
jgi:DNA-binding beta-propeller fold protein YncE